MIFTHADELERAPLATVRVERERACESVEQGAGGVVAKYEAVRFRSAPIIAHGVREPADFPHDRNRAVPKTVHLIQSAGLEPRRHEEDVGAPLNQMREPFVEPDARTNAIRESRRERRPEILIPRFAGTEDDERRVELRQIVLERGDEVEAFLVDHARDHADQWPLHGGLVRDESVSREDGGLRRLLARKIVGAVRLRQIGIVRGIPFLRVDPVQDADEIRATLTQDAVEPEPELRRLNLLRVPRADGGDDVRVIDAALQKTDPPPVLEALERE